MASNSQLSNSQLPRSIFQRRAGELSELDRDRAGIGISAASAAGCAKARAATVPDGPPLAMPQPPPRVFVPVDEEEPLAASPVVPETPTGRGAASSRARPPRRAARRLRSTEKPEPAPQPPQPAPEPQRELRAASTPADAEADKKIRALLADGLDGILGKSTIRSSRSRAASSTSRPRASESRPERR